MPGVGAFAACMEGLRSVGGDMVIKDRLRAGSSVLGVAWANGSCSSVVWNMVMASPVPSADPGDVGLLDADVVPRVGIPSGSEGSIDEGVGHGRFYFVHSFAAMGAAPASMSTDQIDFGGAEEHCNLNAHLWSQPFRRRLRTRAPVSPRSSIRRSPPKPVRNCCAVG